MRILFFPRIKRGFLNFFRRRCIKSTPPEKIVKVEDKYQDEPLQEYVEVTDELDLHGFFPEQVNEMVPDFLENAVQLGLEEVRIIHGKGKGKMKATVLEILSAHPLVAAFRDAPLYSSGWGATVVRLKRSQNPP